jgi:hypothetical protein
MAGKVVVSTLNNDTGVLATQNGMTGIAKAWVNFNGTGTVAIRSSFNVSSITDNGTGDYTINFTTAFADTNYSFVGFTRSDGTSATNNYILNANSTSTKTTSALQVISRFQGGATGGVYDSSEVNVSVFSS